MKYLFTILTSLTLCACGSLGTSNHSSSNKQQGIEIGIPASEVRETAGKPQPEVTAIAETKPGLIESLVRDFSWDRHNKTPAVQKRIKSYQAKPGQLEQILARSAEFLPLIAEQITARGLPAELAFLPLVESGYQTDIYSRAGAAGLWQLMPATARHLGMQIDWWYDERLDIQLSTDRALDYLEYLNKQFDGDWELAITAYNGGEGHVRSRMRKAKSKNFWDLSLKRETTDYLPRLLAIAEILGNPKAYSVDIPDIGAVSGLNTIVLDRQVDLRLAASTAGIEYKKFKKLNPDFQRWISPPTGRYKLLLPRQNAALLQGRLDELEPDQLAGWDHYRVKSGDTLTDIAQEFGTSVRSLTVVNELPDSRIYARQELLIPRAEGSTAKELYIVQSGDSLWTIAKQNNLSINQLRKLNAIHKESVIQPGQVLILHGYLNGRETTYEVRPGDSLSEIAHQFDVAVTDLKTWNSLGSKDLIYPGQVLKIPRES